MDASLLICLGLLAGAGAGFLAGLIGVGGGILTNLVMTLIGIPMHKSIGRALAGHDEHRRPTLAGLCRALALSAVMTIAVRAPSRLRNLAQFLPRASPLPWIVLAMRALAFGVFAVHDPQQFLAGCGDGMTDGAASFGLLGP